MGLTTGEDEEPQLTDAQERALEILGVDLGEEDGFEDVVETGKTSEERFGTDQFDWVDNIRQQILRDLKSSTKDSGYNSEQIENWFESQVPGLSEYLIGQANRISSGIGSSVEWPQTLNDFQQLEDWGRNWLAGRDTSGIVSGALVGVPSTGGGGGGGVGRKTLSPEEIRAQFDVDQLAKTATDQYRGLLFDEPKDSRAIATAYVDAVVANPEQKLDYNTFVRSRIQKEPRYNLLYKNKPKGMTEEQFFAPYVNTASQMLAPREIQTAVSGAAQLGASQQQFRERIARSDSQTSSAPFITEFEGRIQDLAGVFKG